MKYSTVFDFRMWLLTVSVSEIIYETTLLSLKKGAIRWSSERKGICYFALNIAM